MDCVSLHHRDLLLKFKNALRLGNWTLNLIGLTQFKPMKFSIHPCQQDSAWETLLVQAGFRPTKIWAAVSRFRFRLAFCLMLGFLAGSRLYAEPLVQIETVEIGHPGNVADLNTGFGAVAYKYRLGKFEVSLASYTAFLNAVAASDPYTLYNPLMMTDLNIAGIARAGESGSFVYSVIGTGDRPVSQVSWFDAARFCNWLHNGAIAGGDTENGAYPLNGALNGIIPKNPDAKWWIPTEEEWYKAAYFQPKAEGGDADNYWLYAMRSNDLPGNQVGDLPNQANYCTPTLSVTGEAQPAPAQNYLTPGGAYTASGSFYGTSDQTGNVWEWIDAVMGPEQRSLRGGGWSNLEKYQPSTFRHSPFLVRSELPEVGFRVATATQP